MSIEFVALIYNSTKVFPTEELFGLTAQMRRSAVSIPSNIAEGSARNHSKEFRQFLYIALGSASELDTLLLIANKLDFINNKDYQELFNKLTLISEMLQDLIKSIKTNSK